jgi:pyruvate carboxylase subunit B
VANEQARGVAMTYPLYTATIGGRDYKIQVTSEKTLEVNGKECEFDFSEAEGSTFSLIVSQRSYTIDLARVDLVKGKELNNDGQLGKVTRLSVNGRHYDVGISDQRTLFLRSFLAKARAQGGTEVVRAPMPGLISRIEATAGQELKKGQGLLVLEAMKMENEIRAHSDCRVRAIHVARGKPVEKGEPLVTIEVI